jgi:hypothetical protein
MESDRYEQTRRYIAAAEHAEYVRETQHWDLGYSDGEAGRPERTSAMGSYGDDYASGYEAGRTERIDGDAPVSVRVPLSDTGVEASTAREHGMEGSGR